MRTRRDVLAGSAAGLLAVATSAPAAFAQVVKKSVHIIVGFPAGGGTDVIARILADGCAAPMRRPSWWRTSPAQRRASPSNM
jgi:tripartite-type tricarboxylate transporter receptor subunit TctC